MPDSGRGRVAIAAPLLLSAFLLWPCRDGGPIGGVPLGQVGVLALASTWIIWAFRGRSLGWPLAAAMLALKIGASVLLLERGLVAEYGANTGAPAPVERSVEYPRARFTRVDRALDFGPQASADVPLFFQNDFLRFNFYNANEPSRATLPYAATWTGFLFSEEAGPLEVYLRGAGVRADATVDGFPLATLTPDQARASGARSLRGGWRRLRVTVVAPQGSGRVFSAGIVDASGREHPFSAEQVLTRRASGGQMIVDRMVRACAIAIDAALLLWLAVAALQIRSVPHLLCVAAVADAWIVGRPWVGRLMVLPGGSDMLTYETYARDILQHGPLMTLGSPVGSGGSFYYQPLYPYVLALLHWCGGDGFFVVVFVQRLLVGVSAALVWRMTHLLFGSRVGVVGAALAAAFLYLKLGTLASTLLAETVFIPLVLAWTLLLIVVASRGDNRGSAWTGVVGGLATLSRSTLLLAWPVAIGGLAVARRRAGSGIRAIALTSACMLAVAATATIRNWVVAREFVPIATSLPVNLYIGNEPPSSLDTHGVEEFRLYRWVGRDPLMRKVLEFAVHAPALFARNLLNKALYTLGFFSFYVAGAGVSPTLVACWLAAACGAWIAGFRPAAGSAPGAVRGLPGAIAITHFVSVVLIFPHVYGDRLILPFYALILPYAAVAVAAFLDRWTILTP